MGARTLREVAEPGGMMVVIESVWKEWDDLLLHQASGHAEAAILHAFGAIMAAETPTIRRFEDVAVG